MQTEQYEGEVTAIGENIGIVPDAAMHAPVGPQDCGSLKGRLMR